MNFVYVVHIEPVIILSCRWRHIRVDLSAKRGGGWITSHLYAQWFSIRFVLLCELMRRPLREGCGGGDAGRYLGRLLRGGVDEVEGAEKDEYDQQVDEETRRVDRDLLVDAAVLSPRLVARLIDVTLVTGRSKGSGDRRQQG